MLDNELRIRTVNESFSKTFLIPPRDAEGSFSTRWAEGVGTSLAFEIFWIAYCRPANPLTTSRWSGSSRPSGPEI